MNGNSLLRVLVSLFLTSAAAIYPVGCSTSGGGGTNTNWVACESDRTCPADQRCIDKKCVADPGGADGGGSDASAQTNPDASGQTEAGCLPAAVATCGVPSTPTAAPLVGWTWYGLEPTPFDQLAAWSVGPNAAWTAGAYGSLTYWEGTVPKVVDSGVHDTLTDLWGSGPNDIWAVGTGGAFLHYDGDRWQPVQTPVRVDWRAITGSGPSDAWAMGECGALIHYDGAAWSQMGAPGASPLKAIWAAGPNDLWAMAADAIFHFDGTCWAKPEGQRTQFFGFSGWDRLVGHGPKDVWVRLSGTGIGAMPLSGWTHWDGTTWADVAETPGTTPEQVVAATPAGVWPNGLPSDLSGAADDLWAVGATGSVWHSNGVTWSELSSGSRANYSSVWGASPTNVFAMSKDWTHFGRWDGATWKSVPTNLQPSTDVGRGFWLLSGTADDDVWAAGTGMAHWDGAQWTEMTDPANLSYDGIWAGSRTDAWAIGINDTGVGGFATHWDGAAWKKEVSWTDFRPKGITGTSGTDVWVVGQFTVNGAQVYQQVRTVLHFDGSAWTTSHGGVEIPGSTTDSYFSSVVAAAPDHAWAFGTANATWNGVAWTETPDRVVPYGAFAGWANSVNDLWTVDLSDIGHWDGQGWTTMPSPGGAGLAGIWGDSSTGLWIVGSGGRVLRYLR